MDLDCDIEDSYVCSLDYANMVGSLLVDVVGRNALRNLVINFEYAQLQWRCDRNQLEIYDSKSNDWKSIEIGRLIHEKGYSKNINENMYIDEIKSFLDGIENAQRYPNTIDKDLAVLRLLEELEDSDGGFERENKNANYLHLEEKLKSIKKRKIDFLLLPEMSFTGFSMNTTLTKEGTNESIKRIGKLAKQYNMAIGFGWVKDCGLKSENHYTVINKKGNIVSDYTKIHPFSFYGEDKKIRPGNDIISFKLEDIDFSSFICYDLRFPEVFQIASKTASVIFLPANWPANRREHWKCLLQARAIENQVYILAINCVGQVGDQNYSGDSCIIDPNGQILAGLADTEGIVEYELIDNTMMFRKNFPVKNDRREDLYHKYVLNNTND